MAGRRSRRQAGPSDYELRLLHDAADRPGDAATWWFGGYHNAEAVAALWRQNGVVVIRQWAVDHPGTRPSLWWQFEAPQPRHRVGGIGTAAHERLAVALNLEFGVPTHWITDSLAAALERATGRPIGVPAVDPDDPPRFESQASYLERLGLLLPGEAKRLRPADFEPERVAVRAEG